MKLRAVCQCDRCGIEYEEQEHPQIPIDEHRHLDMSLIDLCPICMSSLERWWQLWRKEIAENEP